VLNKLEMGRYVSLVIVAALAALGAAPEALAQNSALQRKLAAAKALECTFATLATGNWQGAKPTAAVAEAKLEVSFSAINIDEGTAEADGGFGAAYIIVRYAQGYLHLMQMSEAGPLHVTTVFAAESSPGRFKAAHTRHEYSPTMVPGFTSRPELYVGDCAVK
jgi:hypothetical protein